jgi:Calpain family cysteine protease
MRSLNRVCELFRLPFIKSILGSGQNYSSRVRLRNRRTWRPNIAPAVESLDRREMLSAAATFNLTGSYFVQSNNKVATITQEGSALTLRDEFGRTTTATLQANQFTAWGQIATVQEDGAFTKISWKGNSWDRVDLSGTYFVHSNNQRATIAQNGLALTLTDEFGNITNSQLVNANQFVAWGQTASIVQNGYLTQVLWNGNSWDRGQLGGTYFVKSGGRAAISQDAKTLTLTDEFNNTTQATWLNATQFYAFGQVASIVQNGFLTHVQWAGNSWDRPQLNGSFIVKSNGSTAKIAQTGSHFAFVDEKNNVTQATWLNPSTFSAWGLTAQVTQSGYQTSVVWPGNSWNRSMPDGTSISSDLIGRPVVNDFFKQMPDSSLQNLARVAFEFDESISRTDLIGATTDLRPHRLGMFSQVQADGTVSSAEFVSLQVLVNQPTILGMPYHVFNLAQKLVNGDVANRQYQGTPLGNLGTGATASHLQKLVDKWFLGKDHPSYDPNPWNGLNELTFGGYSPVFRPLFLKGGPKYTDVHQGALWDCVLLSSLAAVNAKNPKAISSMFIDNLDGTWSVRIHSGTSQAQYVTVDNQLPQDGYLFARPDLFYPGTNDTVSSGALWVALAEKAYAQMNESGWLLTNLPGENSYQAFDGAPMSWGAQYLHSITGKYETRTFGIPTASTLAWSFQTGRSAIVGTAGATQSSDLIVPTHAYALVGYDATSVLPFTFYNPWGELGGYSGSTNKYYPGTIKMSIADVSNYFGGLAWTKQGIGGGEPSVETTGASAEPAPVSLAPAQGRDSFANSNLLFAGRLSLGISSSTVAAPRVQPSSSGHREFREEKHTRIAADPFVRTTDFTARTYSARDAAQHAAAASSVERPSATVLLDRVWMNSLEFLHAS